MSYSPAEGVKKQIHALGGDNGQPGMLLYLGRCYFGKTYWAESMELPTDTPRKAVYRKHGLFPEVAAFQH
jgi:hypothetical protein